VLRTRAAQITRLSHWVDDPATRNHLHLLASAFRREAHSLECNPPVAVLHAMPRRTDCHNFGAGDRAARTDGYRLGESTHGTHRLPRRRAQRRAQTI
jgi:hypothetical protein